MPTTISRTMLREPIGDAPIARDFPRLNRVVVAAHARSVWRIAPVLRDFSTCRLNGAEFVGAARHQHTLSAIPLPVKAEPRVRHGIRRRSKLGVLPTLAAVGRHLDLANRAPAGPGEAADFVEARAGELLAR